MRTLGVIVGRVFSEAFMGLLALVALATAVGPLVFDVTPDAEHALTVIEWSLVGIFATEFVISGVVARDFRAWATSPWRIVDVVTIVGPVAALLPHVSDAFSGSLALRSLRVGRAVAFGTRAGTAAAGKLHVAGSARNGTPVVTVLGERDRNVAASTWDRLVGCVRANEPACWMHGMNIDRLHVRQLVDVAGFSGRDAERLLGDQGRGKVRATDGRACALLQLPTVADSGFPEVLWNDLLVIATDQGIVTAVDGEVRLQDLTNPFDMPLKTTSFPARVLAGILSLARDRHGHLFQCFDEEARRLEATEDGSGFLRGTFRLRREISSAALELRRLKDLARGLADGAIDGCEADLRDEPYLDDLAQDTEALYTAMTRLKDDLQSLIELHINLKSFEMNRFLKLLAVISFVGLIPSIVGGLLGTNIEGQPFPVTLGQIAFVAVMGTAIAVYVFAVKGWLR